MSRFRKRPRRRRGGIVKKAPTRFRKRASHVPGHFIPNVRTGGFLGIELKFYDTKLAATALVTNTDASGGELDPSATIVLNSVIQADGESGRDGRQILMKSIFINGVIDCPIQINETALKAGCHIQLWLVLDKQTNGATINSEDVFVNVAATAIGGTSLLRNLQNTHRFSILDSWETDFDLHTASYDGTNIEQGGLLRRFKLFSKLGMKVNYKTGGTTEDIANIMDNSLHLIGFCTDTGLIPRITYSSRLRFVG